MLYTLGLGDRIVADTTNCDYPPAAKSKPHIGDMHVNIEAIVALKPDLVVGDSDWNARDVARLKELHVNVYAPHPTSFADVQNEFLVLGHITGTSAQAKAVVAGMKAKASQATQLARGNARRARVLAVSGYDPLYVTGKGTYIDEMVTLAGGTNVVTAQGFPTWSKEAAVASQPDLIICGPEEARQIEADPAWKIVPAVRNKHVDVINSDLLDRPGPRLADGLLQVARLIHGVAQGSKP
jgi:iron complex transport system substrate-binding protein